jgi:hypothetical protein
LQYGGKEKRMTLESYEKARDIVMKIRSLDADISELKDIMRNDTSKWIMEVRPNKANSLRTIKHYGILPDILDKILAKHLENREALVDELKKL